MYTSYFGFNEKPFTLTPNPRFMFLSNRHEEALAHLRYGIDNHHGFIKLIGEVGTGKTTLLRTLLNQLGEDKYRTALIFNSCLSGVDLLRSINQEYGIRSDSDTASELLNSLNQFLLAENSKGHTVVLVIDEAQNLKPEVLEHIRLLSNLETDNDKLIQIILAGQPELKSLLKRNELRQLNQRIAIRYALKPLTREETSRYIRHRTNTASPHGGAFFSTSTTLPIHLYTRGNPRMINILCDRALLIAFTHEQRIITPATILKAIWELKGMSGTGTDTRSTESCTQPPPMAPLVEEVTIELTSHVPAHHQDETDEIIELTDLHELVDADELSDHELIDLGTELRREFALELEQQPHGTTTTSPAPAGSVKA